MFKKRMIFIISAIIFIVVLPCVISIFVTNSKNTKKENNITNSTISSNISESVKSTTLLTNVSTTDSIDETKLTTAKKRRNNCVS